MTSNCSQAAVWHANCSYSGMEMTSEVKQDIITVQHFKLARQVLDVLNSSVDWENSIHEITGLIRRELGFDAVGLRLKDGDDFPYYTHEGFSADFISAENQLAVPAENGRGVCRDASGKISLECTCGMILSGRCDPSAPNFTKGGSIWTNDAPAFLEIPPDQDPRLRPRNRCIHEGFRSVALIPFRVAGDIAGLLQLNDRAGNRFSAEMMDFLEGLASSIGMAISRRQSEANLKKTEELHSTILRTAMSGFWLLDPRGRILEVNEAYCTMSGYSEQELLKMSVSDLEAREKPHETADHIRQIMEQRENRFETRHRRKNGEIIDVEISAQYSPNDGGMFVAFIRDITRRKKMEEELYQRRKELFHMERVQTMSELASSLAHEINQPLAGIMSNAQAAQRFLAAPAPDLNEVRAILADIISDDRRAGEVIVRLRALLRKGETKCEVLNINDIIMDVLSILHGEMVIWNISVNPQLSADIPRVCADRVQIGQVIINLMLNAQQAMVPLSAGRERRIVVSSSTAEPGFVRVSICDSGEGIAADHLDRIFESFYTTKKDGLGMGLSICRSIVTACGGRIWAENAPEGGARFSFTLPAAGAVAGVPVLK